ncbi:MAG: hypothetical protein LBM99_02595 [Bacillales bacterium]|jgi:xylulokinase|nr:hypothetical protein [Bacillales bacterium]
MKIAGLDIGTSSCKLSIFAENGEPLSSFSFKYDIQRNLSEHEIDANVLKDAVFNVLKEADKQYNDINGLGITSFGETFVLLDNDDKVLCNSILYTDNRGKEQLNLLIAKLGEKSIKDITGLYPHEMYSISKLMWIKENNPEVFAKVKKILLIEDYVAYLLTGIRQISYSLASRTMCFDINNFTWSLEILKIAGIEADLFSKPVQTGTKVGFIKLPFLKNTEVVSVGHDQIAAIIGTGANQVGDTVDGGGSVQCFSYIVDKKTKDSYDFGKYCFTPFLVPDTYVLFVFIYAGGALLKWCSQIVSKSFVELESEIKPSGLLILPHILGAGTPYMNIEAKGAILGLTSNTTEKDIYQGCLEGIAYELKLNEEILNKNKVYSKKILATGGANSLMFLKIKSKILKRSFVRYENKDVGTIGCIMSVGMALNIFKSYEEACQKLIKVKDVVSCFDDKKEYLSYYKKYKKVYQRIKDI